MRCKIPWTLLLLLQSLLQYTTAAPRGCSLNSRQDIDVPLPISAEGADFTRGSIAKHNTSPSYTPSSVHTYQAFRSIPSSSIPRPTPQNPRSDDDSISSPKQSFRFENTQTIALPRLPLRPLESLLDTDITIKEQVLLQRRRRNDKASGPAPAVIVFGVVGGLIGTIVLVLCGRSILHYIRMPQRDLVADHIDRYNLEREFAEIEEADLGMLYSPGEASYAQSPPPYQEAPNYEDAMKVARVALNTPRS